MNFTGSIQNIAKDWNTGKYQITFVVNEPSAINQVDSMWGTKLSIEAKKYRAKRSLDANAYAWALMTKIAEATSSPGAPISKDDVYEDMLQHYGPFYEDDDGYIVITVKSEVDMSKIQGHWKFYKRSDDGRFCSYLMIKGSSEYDTSEMARFIDGVIQEAKTQGIETATPDEIERMKATWGNNQ